MMDGIVEGGPFDGPNDTRAATSPATCGVEYPTWQEWRCRCGLDPDHDGDHKCGGSSPSTPASKGCGFEWRHGHPLSTDAEVLTA